MAHKKLPPEEKRKRRNASQYKWNAKDRRRKLEEKIRLGRFHFAHTQLRRHVKSGDIIKPKRCEKCDRKTYRLEAHHEDYTKPLEVKWLCQSCHRKAHTVRKAVRDTMSTRATRRGRMKLLSTNRVAEILEVSPRTVAKWIRDGELKGVKMYPSKNWRVEEAELEQFIRSRRVSP